MSKFFAYRNLTKKCWSLKGDTSQRVEHRLKSATLKNCVFKVREGARQRVIKTRQKNVHAFVVGQLMTEGEEDRTGALDSSKARRASYNPYKNGYFFDKESGEELKEAKFVLLSVDGTISYIAQEIRPIGT